MLLTNDSILTTKSRDTEFAWADQLISIVEKMCSMMDVSLPLLFLSRLDILCENKKVKEKENSKLESNEKR